MRPPFRSVSFPSLRQWGALLPPKKAKRLQRDCTPLRPSCWPLDFVGKCSLVSLARPWLGRLPSVASLRLSLAPLVLGSGFACLGYAPPARLCRRSTSVSQFRSLRSFVLRFTPKIKAVFSRKKSVRGERTFFPKMAYLVFVPPPLHKNKICKKSTLHNTQLWCIFYPSAFGYGKCPITCVMYKPLRLWLRGSTFLQKLRPIDRLCRRSLVLRLVAPPARALLVRPPLQRSARPPLQAFVLRFPASARPPLQAFDLRRGRLRGDLPPLRLRLRLGRFGRLCLPPLLGWCSVSAPLRPC